MKNPSLKVAKREIFGKKVKQLRREGILPGNVYGKDIDSTPVQVEKKEFLPVYKQVGETGLIDLDLNGKSLTVLIHNVAKDYLRDEILHADFFKVNLKEKIKTSVPILLVGEAQAVTDRVGLVQQMLSEVEVEALPQDLPEKIEVDITELAEVDEYIPVEELKTPSGVVILTDPNQSVVKITELVSKEAEEQAAEEAAASEAAKEEGAESEGQEVTKEKEEQKTEDNNSEEKPKE